jgi:hypothetical protein
MYEVSGELIVTLFAIWWYQKSGNFGGKKTSYTEV